MNLSIKIGVCWSLFLIVYLFIDLCYLVIKSWFETKLEDDKEN